MYASGSQAVVVLTEPANEEKAAAAAGRGGGGGADATGGGPPLPLQPTDHESCSLAAVRLAPENATEMTEGAAPAGMVMHPESLGREGEAVLELLLALAAPSQLSMTRRPSSHTVHLVWRSVECRLECGIVGVWIVRGSMGGGREPLWTPSLLSLQRLLPPHRFPPPPHLVQMARSRKLRCTADA